MGAVIDSEQQLMKVHTPSGGELVGELVIRGERP